MCKVESTIAETTKTIKVPLRNYEKRHFVNQRGHLKASASAGIVGGNLYSNMITPCSFQSFLLLVHNLGVHIYLISSIASPSIYIVFTE